MRVTVGKVVAERIEERLGLGFEPSHLFPAVRKDMLAAQADWLMPGYLDVRENRLRTSSHSWLIRTGRSLVLIDTCVGNHKERPQVPRFHQCDLPWLENLARAGVQPEDVDVVLCTHLHCDHVGWNTRLVDGQWRPTFPRARYLFGRREFARWDVRRPDYQHREINDYVFDDSIRPVLDAGQVVLVDDGYDIDGVLTVEPAPGHTDGHVRIRIASEGQVGYCSGDIFHHPLQVPYPGLYTPFDDDQARGIETRHALLRQCEHEHALLLPAHFAPPHACFVTQRGGLYRPDFDEVAAVRV